MTDLEIAVAALEKIGALPCKCENSARCPFMIATAALLKIRCHPSADVVDKMMMAAEEDI